MIQFLQPAPGEPPVTGGAVLLQADEIILGRAYAVLIPIVNSLIDDPFGRDTYTAMEQYLSGPAWPAAEAYARLSQLDEQELAQRLTAIESAAMAATPSRDLL